MSDTGIPERGPKRDAALRKLKKERLTEAGKAQIELVADLYDARDRAGTTDEIVKVDKAISEILARAIAHDKGAADAAIVEMRDYLKAGIKQANELDKLH